MLAPPPAARWKKKKTFFFVAKESTAAILSRLGPGFGSGGPRDSDPGRLPAGPGVHTTRRGAESGRIWARKPGWSGAGRGEREREEVGLRAPPAPALFTEEHLLSERERIHYFYTTGASTA